ncbi:MAG: nSTAND3 domain-containing NTPase [Solirubrobacteraceae bacterium]
MRSALAGRQRRSVVLLTNFEGNAAGAALEQERPGESRRLGEEHRVLGPLAICRRLDASPELRARVPSVLGLRDVRGLIGDQAGERSTFDLPAAQALARVFVPTRAYAAARSTLAHHSLVVLTGAPEMGKTAIARMLALAALCEGVEAHECTTPHQVRAAFDPQRSQLFVADDAFGSTEYRPDAAELWARELGAILPRLDARHRLIWTSRPAPLKAALARLRRQDGSNAPPASAAVLVDASALSLEEKALILFRHAKDRELSQLARASLRSRGATIVEHPHFTPERIRRFASGRLARLDALAGTLDESARVAALIQEELSCPTEAMLASFHALEHEHRELLVALLDAPAGLIDERQLAQTTRRHHDGGLSHPPSELIDRLADHFLSIAPLGIDWVHPSWRDLVIDELRREHERRTRFLARCGVEGALLALSLGGGPAGERSLPLLVCDADWDVLAIRLARLVRELDDRDLARLLGALRGVLVTSRAPARRAEARDLAVFVLGCCRGAWEARERVLPTSLLSAWLELREVTDSVAPAPCLLRTWIETHPGSELFARPLSREAMLRIDGWLDLVRVIGEHEQRALSSFEFRPRDEAALVELIPDLVDVHDPELQPLARGVLVRIAEVLPRASPVATIARRAVIARRDAERERWWTPSDLGAPPSYERVGARSESFNAADVERLLLDL